MAILGAPPAVIHKPTFGVSGLSKELWAMEKGQLNAYHSLLQSQEIPISKYGAAVTFSLAKHLLRVLRVSARNLAQP